MDTPTELQPVTISITITPDQLRAMIAAFRSNPDHNPAIPDSLLVQTLTEHFQANLFEAVDNMKADLESGYADEYEWHLEQACEAQGIEFEVESTDEDEDWVDGFGNDGPPFYGLTAFDIIPPKMM